MFAVLGAVLALSQVAAPGETFQEPYPVDRMFRLALTPTLDGAIEEGEWEPLAPMGAGQSYLQWEPRKLFWAARVPKGQDAVLTLDWNGDGWLVGDDNFEIRATLPTSGPSLEIRRVNGDDPNGPAWVPTGLVPEAVAFAAEENTDGTWDVEVRFLPQAEGEAQEGKGFGVRTDAVAAGADLGPAYTPRRLAFVHLALDQGVDIPSGLTWRPEFKVRSIPGGDRFTVKYRMDRTDPALVLRSIAFQAQGLSAAFAASGSMPVPPFDGRGRVWVEYETLIARDAPLGYRILDATVTTDDGATSTLRSSFRIADLLDFDVDMNAQIEAKGEPQVLRGSVTLRSQALARVEGVFRLTAPQGWAVLKGRENSFVIYHPRGTQRIGLEVIVPGDVEGVFPLTLRAEIGDRVLEDVVFVRVQAKED